MAQPGIRRHRRRCDDEGDLSRISEVIRKAKDRKVKVILVANEVSPMALHQLMRLGADDFVPYPLPEGALHDAIERIRREPQPVAAVAAAPAAEAAPQEEEGPAPTFKAKGDRRAFSCRFTAWPAAPAVRPSR
jgi:pilus assembly protein CpaE